MINKSSFGATSLQTGFFDNLTPHVSFKNDSMSFLMKTIEKAPVSPLIVKLELLKYYFLLFPILKEFNKLHFIKHHYIIFQGMLERLSPFLFPKLQIMWEQNIPSFLGIVPQTIPNQLFSIKAVV